MVKTINMPPILFHLLVNVSQNKILIIAKLNGRKDLVLRSCVYSMIFPSKQLSTQS